MAKSIRRLPLLSAVLFGLLTVFNFSPAPGTARAAGEADYKKSIVGITVPDEVLVDQNGDKVRLKDFLTDSGQPVVVDFIYGTCTTICPILSAGFANLQRKLGDHSRKVRLVSITIDPENDTPPVLKEYLERYNAKPGWDFLTGSRADIDYVMRAFDAYFPDKMSHLPLNFIREPEGGKWLRLYGLMGSSDFMNECQQAGIK